MYRYLSPRSYAQDAHSEDDEDVDATPKLLTRPQLDDPTGTTIPSQDVWVYDCVSTFQSRQVGDADRMCRFINTAKRMEIFAG